MPPFGTKNLGLIKAIHVGVNPPLNTKILWYNNSNNPYTTGPAKVHYYYDVILADWYPLLSWMGAGNFTYIAFASDCQGADFSLTFDTNIHCHWAIVNSVTPIDPANVNATLFTNLWTEFCKCSTGSGNGNFTYYAFSNNCGENDFGIEPYYEKECPECKLVDSYENKQGSVSYSVSNVNDGLLVTVTNATAGKEMSIDLGLEGLPLDDLVKYSVELNCYSGWNGGAFEINIGYSGDSVWLNSDVTAWKTDMVSLGSKLVIKVPNSFVGMINEEFFIKIGNLACNSDSETATCLKSHWAIINSETKIEELTPELFDGLWIPVSGGCGSCNKTDSGLIHVHSQQIEQLFQIFEDYKTQTNNQINDLQNQINDLQNQLENCCEDVNGQIENINSNIGGINSSINSINSSILTQNGLNETRFQNIEDSFEPANLAPIVEPIIDAKLATYTTSVVDPKDLVVSNKVDTEKINIENDYNFKLSVVDNTLQDHELRIHDLENP